jgi:hypothetical protein
VWFSCRICSPYLSCRNLQLVHVEENAQTKAGIKKIADLVAAQAKRQDQSHSELRSSNSSTMASSQSQHEMLKELRSMQSVLSGKMDKLFDAISASNSQRSSLASNSPGDDPDPEAPALGKLARTGSLEEAPFRRAFKEGGTTEQLASLVRNIPDELCSKTETVDSDENATPRTIAELLEDFNFLAGQYLDGIVAEYVLAVEQWQYASMRQRVIDHVRKQTRRESDADEFGSPNRCERTCWHRLVSAAPG